MEKISVAVRFRPTAPASSDDSSTSGGDREWRIDDTRISLLHRAAPIPSASFGFGKPPPPPSSHLEPSLSNPPLVLN